MLMVDKQLYYYYLACQPGWLFIEKDFCTLLMISETGTLGMHPERDACVHLARRKKRRNRGSS